MRVELGCGGVGWLAVLGGGWVRCGGVSAGRVGVGWVGCWLRQPSTRSRLTSSSNNPHLALKVSNPNPRSNEGQRTRRSTGGVGRGGLVGSRVMEKNLLLSTGTNRGV